VTDDATPGPDHEPVTDDNEDAHLRRLLRAGAEGSHGDAFSAIFAVRCRVRRRRIARTGVAACAMSALAVVGLVAVAGHSGAPHPPRPVTEKPAPAFRLTGALVSFNACSDYLSYLKSQAMAVVGPYGLETYGVSVYGSAGLVGPGGDLIQRAGAPAAATAMAPNNDLKVASPSTSAGPGASTFSQTNDQVAGVDEPDTVKTDGRLVVTLAGSTLRVLDVDAHVIGSLQISGDSAGGLLLDGSRAVVLSSAPSATPGTVGFVPWYQSGPYLGTGAGSSSASETARAAVVDLSDPTHPYLVRTFLFDGEVVAARLVDGQVRLVVRSDGPRLNFVTPSSTGDTGSATATNRQLIASSTIADWLPAWQMQNPDGSATARQPMSTCGSVARPQQASGLSTVTVLSLDPAATAPGPGTSVVAAGETVYATPDHVYVAGPTGTTSNPYDGAQPEGCCSVLPPRGASTHIYAFSVPASGPPVFDGAGTVPGWLVNSYAMDEDAQGHLRVASTAQGPSGTTQSQITVLAGSGNQLTPVGAVGGLGKGEFIKTVRFIGDQAYVVTFQSFDPMYVVQLANPEHPTLSGELDQPGFSEFLYPLPGQRLLGVGVEITGGEPSGLVVATYDVSDPAHPRRLDFSVLASGFQYVAQGFDPHAFLYWPGADLALVAVPGGGLYGPTSGGSGVAAYQVGGTGKLTHSATLAHGTEPASRSIVINGQVWAFTDTGVITADLTNLPVSAWHGY
jgi:hypothetical protein